MNSKLYAFLSGLLALYSGVQAAGADKKYDLTDLAHVAGPLMRLPGVIAMAKEAGVDYKSLDDVARAEVLAALKAEFNLENDVLEQKIEAGLEFALAGGKFLGAIQA